MCVFGSWFRFRLISLFLPGFFPPPPPRLRSHWSTPSSCIACRADLPAWVPSYGTSYPRVSGKHSMVYSGLVWFYLSSGRLGLFSCISESLASIWVSIIEDVSDDSFDGSLVSVAVQLLLVRPTRTNSWKRKWRTRIQVSMRSLLWRISRPRLPPRVLRNEKRSVGFPRRSRNFVTLAIKLPLSVLLLYCWWVLVMLSLHSPFYSRPIVLLCFSTPRVSFKYGFSGVMILFFSHAWSLSFSRLLTSFIDSRYSFFRYSLLLLRFIFFWFWMSIIFAWDVGLFDFLSSHIGFSPGRFRARESLSSTLLLGFSVSIIFVSSPIWSKLLDAISRTPVCLSYHCCYN